MAHVSDLKTWVATLIPVLTFIVGIVKDRYARSTKRLIRYCKVREQLVSASVDSDNSAFSSIDSIIANESKRLMAEYTRQSTRVINPAGLIAIIIVAAIEIMITYFLVVIVKMIPYPWGILGWFTVFVIALFMVSFLAVGVPNVLYQDKKEE